MTRFTQICKNADEYSNALVDDYKHNNTPEKLMSDGFIQGAKWADKNPQVPIGPILAIDMSKAYAHNMSIEEVLSEWKASRGLISVDLSPWNAVKQSLPPVYQVVLMLPKILELDSPSDIRDFCELVYLLPEEEGKERQWDTLNAKGTIRVEPEQYWIEIPLLPGDGIPWHLKEKEEQQ